MNSLIDKNISQSQLSNLHRINIDDDDDDISHDDNKNNNSYFQRLTRWLHLINRWKHESIPEVCKHVWIFFIVEFRRVRKTRSCISTLSRALCTNIHIHIIV